MLRERLTDLLEPVVADLGYELVLLEYNAHKGSATLRLYIDSEEGIDVDDCARVSREVAATLDVEDPIRQAYHPTELYAYEDHSAEATPWGFLDQDGHFPAGIDIFQVTPGTQRFSRGRTFRLRPPGLEDRAGVPHPLPGQDTVLPSTACAPAKWDSTGGRAPL